MAKDKIAFVCSNCGQESAKWMGKCPSCGQWNTFKEIRIAADSGSQAAKNAGMTMRHGGVATMFGGQHSEHDAAPMKLRDISAIDEPRIDMRDEELNRVLGGGMVPGSITLLGGEPGIGKSTLTLQTILNMTDRRILYVSGEESAHQIKLRADRLAKGQAMLRDGSSADTLKTASLSSEGAFDHITVLCETQLEKIFSHIQEVAPQLIVIDSIQTISTEEVDSSPGSVSQVRECAASLLRFAKTSGIPVILIGHINKEGTLAGPKILEHIVDTVIQFEGDQHYMYRILRSIKNRFGSTSELGIYEMMQGGLRQVSNPSELLLTEDHDGLSGVAISAAIEGVRPFLVETQALVSTAAYGTPQRSATGFDIRRMNMLLAVLEKRVGMKMFQKDVFLNFAGGFKVADPGLDLAVVAAVISSYYDRPVAEGVCCAGEIGLSGEVRPAPRTEQRISEAARLGFKRIVVSGYLGKGAKRPKGIEVVTINSVDQLPRALFVE